MGRLTEPHLQALLRKGQPVAGKSDGDGLLFTISKSGTAIWKLRYRFGGRPRWMTLGPYSDISLKEARTRALKERARIASNVDVVAERRRSKLALASAKTFAELAEDYMVRTGSSLKPESRIEVRRYLDKDLVPRLGQLRIEEITGAEIVYVVERVAKRSAHVAHRAFEILSQIFKHGVAKHLARSNPCSGLSASAIVGKKERIREAVSLSEAELRELFVKLPEIGRQNTLAIKILLATATRKGELIRARWEQVGFEESLWTIPAENSKNGKAFVIPLPTMVVGWFRELQEIACGSPWVLPGRAGRQPLSRSSLNAALERLSPGIRHFTVHDLRRTARSHLGALGVDVIIAEKCLNHTLGGLIDVYDRGDYLPERRRALELWADFLLSCDQRTPGNVMPLRREAA